MKNHTKILWFITFRIKLWLVQNVNGFIRVYDGTKYLILFYLKKYDVIYNRIWYILFHNFRKIKIDSDDELLLEEILTLRNVNVVTHIKSVFSKDQNRYYYNLFLEKCSPQLAKNNSNFSLTIQ